MGAFSVVQWLRLSVLCLVSCAKSDVREEVTSPPTAVAKTAESDITVTGSRVSASWSMRSTTNSLPAPPPPPPSAPGMYPQWSPPYQDVGRDKFTNFAENAFQVVREAPVSTFSIDVDTASYAGSGRR